jgi:predicted neuraminidase
MAPYRGAGCWSSADHGKTAHFRGHVVIHGASSFDEHHFILRRDGRLWCVMRARTVAKESFSRDGGRTWTPPQDVGFCGFSRIAMLRLASGNLLRVENTPGDGSRRRNNLTAYLSLDDGETWPHRLLLDERDNVSYPCAAQDDTGRIHVIYDHERSHGEFLLASFREEDLLADAPTSADFRLRHPVQPTQ